MAKEPYEITPLVETFARFARWFFRHALKIFLREVSVLETNVELGEVAQVRMPSLRHELPTLLIANHPNGLIDGVIVYATARTTLRAVVKSTLWNQAFLRPLLSIAKTVPIHRKQDMEELEKNLHTSKQKIKTTNKSIDLVSQALYKHTFIIFPKDISHTKTQMAPFKTGGSRMLLSAAAYLANLNDKSSLTIQKVEDLSFQPVGLYFDDARTFRSRGLIHYGKRQYLGTIFSSKELQEITVNPLKSEFVHKLTEAMEVQLAALLPQAPNPKMREFTRRLSTLLYEANRKTKIGDIYQWELVVNGILAHFKEFPKEEALRLQEKVDDYFAKLEEEGIRDAYVQDLNLAKKAYIKRLFLYQNLYWVLAIIFAPITIAGMILYYIPYWLTKKIAFALADGEVELSTYKFLGGLVVFFVAFLIYTVGLASFAWGAGWSWAWFFAVALLPFSTDFFALLFTERFVFHINKLKILFSQKFHKKIYQLKKKQETLIDNLIAYL